MDVMPTFLEIAGTSHPGTEFQGQSVLPIRGRSFWPRVGGDTAPTHGDTDVVPWMRELIAAFKEYADGL